MFNHCLSNCGKFDDEYNKLNVGIPIGSEISASIVETVNQNIVAKTMAKIDQCWASDM